MVNQCASPSHTSRNRQEPGPTSSLAMHRRSSDRAAPTRIMNNIGCGDIFHNRETLITGAIIARKRGPQPNGGAMDVLQHCVDLGNQHKTAAPNRLFNCNITDCLQHFYLTTAIENKQGHRATLFGVFVFTHGVTMGCLQPLDSHMQPFPFELG